jgi:hypothetical protein
MFDRSTHALVKLAECALPSAIRREKREALRRYAAYDRATPSGALYALPASHHPHAQTNQGPILLAMRTTVVASIVAATAALCCATSALAEVGVPAGTAQQAAADALFLQYAPAPPNPGIVCLVDSGVDPTPDTPTDMARTWR